VDWHANEIEMVARHGSSVLMTGVEGNLGAAARSLSILSDESVSGGRPISSHQKFAVCDRGTDESLRSRYRQSIAACNAIDLPWSNGQADGQINRLKAIKRAIYGRAGPELLRARMMPVNFADLHTK
jgi:hypothetical protein